MCHERWLRRREREAQDAREVWLDFERTSPVADPDPPTERPDPTRVEAEEEVVTADR
jgi:hypothetical protein